MITVFDRKRNCKAELSEDLFLAMKIYEFNLQKKPIWYSKLVDEVKSYMSKHKVSDSLDTLSDWGIMEIHYGETEKGRAGACMYITESALHIVKDLQDRIDFKDNVLDLKNKPAD